MYVSDKYNLYYRSTSDKEIYANIFNRQIQNLFHSQLNNINESEDGIISLKIKNNEVELSIKDNKVISVNRTIPLNSQVIYIDDPFILDEVRFYAAVSTRFNYGTEYKKNLALLITETEQGNEVEDELRKTILLKRIDGILTKINSICDGNLNFNSKKGFSYTSSENGLIHINNISAGLKTFAIIKTLLLKGKIEENGIIILDEPEVHLHPKWQLLLAEIIVLLQKEFDLHILLNTHSPYFLEAIEVYSQKHHIQDRCQYYLAENIDKSASISNVTDKTELIYKKLAKPFQDLENERYRDE